MRCAVVTTSRADYGLLRWPMHAIGASGKLELLTVVGGSHLSSRHGMTVREIRADGFEIAAEVDHIVDDMSDVGVATSMGLALSGFAKTYDALKPDLVIVLGDRFEVYAAVAAATILRRPVAHLCGGDVTEGAYDDAFRHGISKAASLHFPSTTEAAQRLKQMGEPSERIFMVGSPGLDALHRISWRDRATTFAEIGLRPRKRNVIVTYHPVTREPGAGEQQIRALTDALSAYGDDIGIVFTGVNADSEGDRLAAHIQTYAAGRENVRLVLSLGQTGYLNAVRHMDAVVGNSSSGLYEVPSLGIPTVNIGNRQAGRLKAASVIDTPGTDATSIQAALEEAFRLYCSQVTNPYGDGHSSGRIVAALEQFSANPKALLRKSFIDLPTASDPTS